MLLALALVLGQYPQHRLFEQPNLPRQSLAFFEAFPASGLGVTTACSTTAPTVATGQTLAFTRASVAECYSNDGQTLTQLASGQPRVSSGTAASSWMGIWVDPGATNSLLWGRDQSNGAWTKTTMTCTRTSTGMRNDANGATRCTATAPNATVCQALVTAAATRTSSGHIKRVTGTGVVSVARDGATYAAITSSLSSTLWRRVVPQDTPGCAGGNCIIVPGMTSGIANPTVCVKLATSGDAVDLDFWQDEAGDMATSPIETSGSAFPRAAEVASVSHAPLRVRSMSAVFQTFGYSGSTVLWDALDGTNATALQALVTSGNRYGNCVACVGGSCPALASGYYYPHSASTGLAMQCEWATDSTTHTIRNAAAATSTAVSLAATTTLYLGTNAGGSQWLGGVIKGVRLDGSTGRALWSGSATGTKAVAWLGDSITAGFSSPTAIPPVVLGQSLGAYVQGLGLAGQTAAGCLSSWRSNIKGRGYTSLVLLCGVNSLAAGATATATMADLQTIMDEARAEGLRVTPVGLTPWANSASWTAGKQTETDALNVLLSAYATTNSLTYVSTASLGTGSPLALTAGNDSGDHIHPNATGSTALAALVQAANP